MIAALFVEKGGAYYGVEGVDPWDVERDARLYGGPWPVVAHPPCQRWGSLWRGGVARRQQTRQLGDDGGCFAAALAAVRRYGGVLEHPAYSRAWVRFGLNRPPREGGWIAADWLYGFDGWTCHVEQGNYGHRARKATWLYAVGVDLPELLWGRAPGEFESVVCKRSDVVAGRVQLPRELRGATPPAFRDVLLGMVRSSGREVVAAA